MAPTVIVDGKVVKQNEAMYRLADAWNIINDHRNWISELEKCLEAICPGEVARLRESDRKEVRDGAEED
jgi:hypothetical protein